MRRTFDRGVAGYAADAWSLQQLRSGSRLLPTTWVWLEQGWAHDTAVPPSLYYPLTRTQVESRSHPQSAPSQFHSLAPQVPLQSIPLSIKCVTW